jgi:peptidoglycan/xylan/chitin deacetylase (PgdA/CDA1 family)
MASTLPIRVLRRLRHRGIGAAACTRPAHVDLPGGAVSFTFDDFPRSAFTAGGAILEKYGVRGTYYAALDLAGSVGMHGPIFDLQDLVAAHRSGHEIACHTYRHVNCAATRAGDVVADIADNAAALAALIPGYAPVNFAYPFGELSLGVKRSLASRFQTCRGISEGINGGVVDLAELRVARIHAVEFDAAALRARIDRAAAEGGWLIFFTHDVADAPSAFGCTSRQLETLVAYAAERASVFPVRDVAARIG